MRPLPKVLLTPWSWDSVASRFTKANFNPIHHIDWPEGVKLVSLGLARANWDYENNKFTTVYSDVLVMKKEESHSNIALQVAVPLGD